MLAPYVWRDGNGFRILMRVVPRSNDPAQKISRAHTGRSHDGVRFTIEGRPALEPSKAVDADDRDGCEDPTVAIDGETYVVYYSGWNQERGVGQLLRASGPAPDRLEKRGIALASQAGRENPKEATIVRVGDGTWRLFFEYASSGASRVGVAEAATIDGPWRQLTDPFFARDAAFDDRHLSPGPVVGTEQPVMFYNGANAGTHWRIGWIAFDAAFERVVARCSEPLIVPPPPPAGESDIAFVASAIDDGETIALYYHVADQHPHRALVRRTVARH